MKKEKKEQRNNVLRTLGPTVICTGFDAGLLGCVKRGGTGRGERG